MRTRALPLLTSLRSSEMWCRPGPRRDWSAARPRPVDLAEIVRLIDGKGLRIAALNLHEPTLDDVFLAKTGYSLEGSGGSARAPLMALDLPNVAHMAHLSRRSAVRALNEPA